MCMDYVPYSEVENIDFQSAKKLKKSLDEKSDKLSFKLEETSAKSKPLCLDVKAPNKKEMENFYAKSNSCNTKTVAISLTPPYSQSFVSKSRNIKL